MKPAIPEYALGDRVLYRDHQGRVQTGTVLSIRARWDGSGFDPFIIYTVSHPTYANRRHYAVAEDMQPFAPSGPDAR